MSCYQNLVVCVLQFLKLLTFIVFHNWPVPKTLLISSQNSSAVRENKFFNHNSSSLPNCVESQHSYIYSVVTLFIIQFKFKKIVFGNLRQFLSKVSPPQIRQKQF